MPFLDTGRPAPDATAGGSTLNPRAVWLLGQVKARAGRAQASSTTVSLDDEADAVLSQIERLEVRKALLEGRIVDAYAALHSIEEQALARLDDELAGASITSERSLFSRRPAPTPLGAMQVARRLELALAPPRRHRVLRERLRVRGRRASSGRCGFVSFGTPGYGRRRRPRP